MSATGAGNIRSPRAAPAANWRCLMANGGTTVLLVPAFLA
jgi:hypothetical protein